MSKILISEGHTDLLMDVCRRRILGERRVLSRVHVPKLRRGGVNLQVCVIGGDFPLFASDSPDIDYLGDAIRLVADFYSELDEDAAAGERAVFPVLDAADVRAAGDERIGFVLHAEGVGLLAGSLERLRVFFQLGLRSLGLTWNGSNHAADGCMQERGRGLSDFGAALVEEADRLGVLLDVSHLGVAGVDDVLALAGGPVIASHSNARGVYDHPRNLSDEHLRGIAATGGTVGLCAYPVLVGEERADLADMLRHLDYLCGEIGAEHVSFGGDFTDFLDDSWSEAAPVRRFKDDLTRPFPAGLETVAEIPGLIEAMTAAGYADGDVRAIMGGNLRRVLEAALPSGEA